MIEDRGKHYLYRHIRLDKNEPFYIGVGTKCDNIDNLSHKRSKTTQNRNKFWRIQMIRRNSQAIWQFNL